ncbi:hypothetical protein ACGRHY_06180 [Streptomyces sp. HK10]|uniref:COG4315 family predicted lipoprotein n=1 Tax=Streptomyces sp. HK10 TaxID=3373255 RepID=UPI003749D14E
MPFHGKRFGASTASVVLCAGLVAALAGCGGQKSEPEEEAVATPGVFASAETRPVAAVGSGEAELGEVAVDIEGFTLYRFDKDKKKPSASHCDGECAKTWKPLTASDGMPIALPGVTPADLGILVREDKTKQVTLGGWPLYRYTGDTAPRQTNGDGVEGTWHAVAPDGGIAAEKKPKK